MPIIYPDLRLDYKVATHPTNGVCLVDNVEANRLQIFFPEIPSEEIRRELKRNGFHWSPTGGAWQRHRSNRATYLAKLILTNHTL